MPWIHRFQVIIRFCMLTRPLIRPVVHLPRLITGILPQASSPTQENYFVIYMKARSCPLLRVPAFLPSLSRPAGWGLPPRLSSIVQVRHRPTYQKTGDRSRRTATCQPSSRAGGNPGIVSLAVRLAAGTFDTGLVQVAPPRMFFGCQFPGPFCSVSCLLSPVSCLPFPVSCFLSPVFRELMEITLFFDIHCQSCTMSIHSR